MDLKFQYDLAAIKFPERLAKELKFAAVVSLTRTAQDIKSGAVQKMRDVFDRPTPWTLNSLAVKPATKQDPVAYVRKKEFGANSAGHILSPHIDGTTRGKRRSEQALGENVVTGKSMPTDKYGNLTASTYTKILSQLKVTSDATQRATNSKRSRRSRKNEAYFKQGNVIYQRKGKTILPALILTRPPNYRKTFPYFETGQATFDRVFPTHFNPAVERAIQAAVRNSGFR